MTVSGSVTVFPNPATKQVHIHFPDSQAQLRILDLQGKEIEKHNIQKDAEITTSHLKQGTYLFEITASNGRDVKRVMKQ
ncbi:MAG: T9SS type A sorting domain-containing protein [Fluviicola sp.]|nr:T9SS type A sorting domain-containing protein [Fluviicola sp.]